MRIDQIDQGDGRPVVAGAHEKIGRYLATVRRVAAEGDDAAALAIARGELPLIVEVFEDLVAEHRPDAVGHCRACARTGRWWWRQRTPCRAVRRVRAVLLRSPVPG
ncbi:hypothetical protein [Saccharothrix syringae]|uniref:hypothetical protein n=1 Tax=Saccharothrix syringae TaxID=103733 RepID=UPI0006924774|nr:hypothetical protein [Saccharothrix syringae]